MSAPEDLLVFQLEEIHARHYSIERDNGRVECFWCDGMRMPCDAAVLLAELTAARALTAKLREGLAGLAEYTQRYEIVSPLHEACTPDECAVAAARALLVSSEVEG